MMSSSGFWTYSSRFLKLTAAFLFLLPLIGNAQHLSDSPLQPNDRPLLMPTDTTAMDDTATAGQDFPEPRSVLYKSLMIPGWGQVVNDQIWKVPVVYALLGGLTGYSIYLTKKYHDYRAAYYNLNENTPEDLRFGPTPDYLQNANLSSLRDNRNFFRNRRDFIYVTILLAYGLNAVDAYVFAHLRSFDVSDDLSMRPMIKPGILAGSSPGITVSLELFKK